MKHFLFALVSLGTLALPSSAQQDGSRMLRPITAPVRYAGTYHLGTGTWTHTQSMALPAVPRVATIYDNSCVTGYYAGITTNDVFTDEGRLPSPTSAVLSNLWGLGNDSERGTQLSYAIDGFQIGYCTSEAAPRAYQLSFFEAYNTCTPPPALATAAIALNNLPASSVAGMQTCWIVDIDLCASSQSFTMLADADGSYGGAPLGVGDTFGWSITLVSSAPNGGDGPLLAGGRYVGGSYQSCSGSDGTVFDTGSVSAVYPANSGAINLACGSLPLGAGAEQGSGMGSLDQFFLQTSTGGMCYWFGGTVSSNFLLQLYSADVSTSVTFCEPGTAGVSACPCGNPPAGARRGCDNSTASGGASIHGLGTPSIAADTLVFTTESQRPTGASILLQGTSTIAAGVVFGQGIRCIAGATKRLYVKSAVNGSISAPGPGDPSITLRSLALGDPLASGSRRYYMAYYRDPIVLGGCPASATFNATNACDVIWY